MYLKIKTLHRHVHRLHILNSIYIYIYIQGTNYFYLEFVKLRTYSIEQLGGRFMMSVIFFFGSQSELAALGQREYNQIVSSSRLPISQKYNTFVFPLPWIFYWVELWFKNSGIRFGRFFLTVKIVHWF